MNQYHKTDLGIESLKQRSLNLNARQRRLLLLIGTDDFDLLAEQFKRRIAPPELLEQLLAMGLITQQAGQPIQAQLSSSHLDTETRSSPVLQNTPLRDHSAEESPVPNTPPSSSTDEKAEQIAYQNQQQTTLEVMDFEQIKQFMAQQLQRHCGLMAKQLINRILAANDLRSLKQCQMQWITSLQESRIPPQELNHYLNQINSSLQKYLS